MLASTSILSPVVQYVIQYVAKRFFFLLSFLSCEARDSDCLGCSFLPFN